jgi:hypothetical protein
MPLFGYALRDFIDVEKHAAWSSLIVFDDMLPRGVDEAAPDRHTNAWTGDVYKIIPALQRHRLDLTVVSLDTRYCSAPRCGPSWSRHATTGPGALSRRQFRPGRRADHRQER